MICPFGFLLCLHDIVTTISVIGHRQLIQLVASSPLLGNQVDRTECSNHLITRLVILATSPYLLPPLAKSGAGLHQGWIPCARPCLRDDCLCSGSRDAVASLAAWMVLDCLLLFLWDHHTDAWARELTGPVGWGSLGCWASWIEPLHDRLQWLAVAPGLQSGNQLWCCGDSAGPTCMHSREETWNWVRVAASCSKGQIGMEWNLWAWFWVSVFWRTNEFFLCFAEERCLEPWSLPLPQIVQHFNKDLFPSPPIFVLCLCSMVVSQIPLLFGNNITAG